MLWFHPVWILKTGHSGIGYWGIHSSVRTAFSLDNVNGQILDGKFVITFDVGANKDRCESETTTLGDLLYDSKVKAYLSEKAWVSLVHRRRGSACAAFSLRTDASNRFYIDRADNQQSRNR
jgi:hypothetical protein